MPNWIFQLIVQLPLVSRLIAFSQKLVIPGFDGIPIYYVLRFFISGIWNGNLSNRAYALAFRFFFAIFPALLFLFALIPYIPVDNFQDMLLHEFQHLLPQTAFEMTKSTIEDLVIREHTGLLSLGVLMTLYFATNGILAIIDAFNQSYHSLEVRSFWKQRLVAFALFIILILLVIVSVILVILNQIIIDLITEFYTVLSDETLLLIALGRWAVILSFFYFSISFIYYLAPSKSSVYKFFSAGSTLATLLIISISLGFAYYVNNFGQYNKLYGSIGTLMVTMLWIYLNCFALLLGFELNAGIVRAGKNFWVDNPEKLLVKN